MSHNESLADRTVGEISSNGVFEAGETGIKFGKDETGVKFGLRFTNKELVIGTAVIVAGALLGRTLRATSLKQVAGKTAQVAETVEEAAK